LRSFFHFLPNVASAKPIEAIMRIKNVKNFQKSEVPYLSNTGIVPQDPFSTHKSRKEKVFKCLYDQYKNGGRGLSQNEIKTQTYKY
jgi:hypothetical protein